MHDLRLVPAAVVCWAVCLLILVDQVSNWWALGVVIGSVMAATLAGHWPQALVIGVCGAATGVLSTIRQYRAENFDYPDLLDATVATRPRAVNSAAGGEHFLINVEGLAPRLPVFVEHTPEALAPGSHVTIDAQYSPAGRPGLSPVTVNGELVEVYAPTGIGRVAEWVSQKLSEAAQRVLGESTANLVPGMVLGDTSGQDQAERELYIDAGLSHLTAVSGLHVATVVTAALILARVCALGPRSQSVVAVSVLVGYALIVGPAPSVLRASITGLVGVAAVLNSSVMPALHALCLAVIGLLLWDSDLAVTYGFALSVAATAGIIAIVPLLYRPLARTRLPDIVVRAVAVSLAADIVTMPLVALMAGRVSVVAVLANVAVTPVVTVVLILGLIATIAAMLPGGVEVLFLTVLEPAAWWIYRVAWWCQQLPITTIEISPWAALLGYGWILAAILAGFARSTVVASIVVMICVGLSQRSPPEATFAPEHVMVIDTLEEITDFRGDIAPETLQPNTLLIVVRDPSGAQARRPTASPSGIPIVFPRRDGQVTIHVDGTQHAADGRF